MIHAPTPNGKVSEEYLFLKKHIGRAEREMLVLVKYKKKFENPSVHGFPTTVDRADQSCRIRPT
jgi:hypothetical protein